MSGDSLGTGESRLLTHARSDDRQLVLWIGTSSGQLLGAQCLCRDLTLLPISNDELPQVAPYARVLVVEISPDDESFRDWAPRAISTGLNHGLRVALVQYEPDGSLPLMEDPKATDSFFAAVKQLPRDPERTQAFYRDWCRVAEWARDHSPGPGASEVLELRGEVPDDPTIRILMRRAFSDLSRVSLELVSGGRSGASVWRIQPDASDHAKRTLPFIAKIHDRQKMLSERSNYHVVRNAVESRLCAPLDSSRCVEGDSLGLVVYDVVERALPFSVALQASPTLLIASLFGQTLRGFYRNLKSAKRAPATELSALKLLKWSSPALRDAAQKATSHSSTAYRVEDLNNVISSISPITFSVGTIHGDLHVRNVLAASAASDVVLIDYGSVRQDSLVAADAACLEVSLAFPSGDERHARCIDSHWRRAAYRYPLPQEAPPLTSGDSWLADALKAIRGQVRLIEPSTTAYALAVAGYLIRHAAYEDTGTVADRALAYELACQLVREARDEIDARQLR